MAENLSRIHLPFFSALEMITRYVRRVVGEQLRSIAFVVIYLVVFQMVVFRSPVAHALQVAGGIGLVVVGLTFFLEGIRLGLMPLGERVGIQLPGRGGLAAIIPFGILLGIGATIAEPAIAALQSVAGGVNPWQVPLLFVLLERVPRLLVLTIAAGVGVATALGMLRFYFGLSLKPFIFTIIPVLIAGTIVMSRSVLYSSVVGLAWDAGAVTTGSVTVPLMLALGIGVSRGSGRTAGPAGGFGLVMLASAFPVLLVMGLALVLGRGVPPPVTEEQFFAPHNREAAMRLFETPEELQRYAFRYGSAAARQSFFHNEQEYREAVVALHRDASVRRRNLANRSLEEWLANSASVEEKRWLTDLPTSGEQEFEQFLSAQPPEDADSSGGESLVRALIRETGVAGRAVLPLTALLGGVLILLLRDRPRYFDEVILGILFAVAGLGFLALGIQTGLAPLGDDLGRQLPTALHMGDRESSVVILENFLPERLVTVVTRDGAEKQFFHFHDGRTVQLVEFDPQRYDSGAQRYLHVRTGFLDRFVPMALLGASVVFLFAFGLGFGSTMAEPGLSALAKTVEELSVGTIRRSTVVRTVSIGVGMGLVAGVARILYGIPLSWLLLVPYILLLPLTWFGDEDFTSIAWDTGGVTTGPVTVPLVIAMGLGLGGALGVADGFGILALASAYPILAMQLYGLFIRLRERQIMRTTEKGEETDD